MATELTMPQMGYDMREGTVVRWLKEEGSQVDDGEPIAEIETDKAVVEFESYAAGILHYIVVPEGTTVPVGQAIAVVGEADEDVPKPAFEAATPTPPATSPRPTTPPMPAEPRDDGPAPRSDVVRASPVARRLAEERGVDLSKITGTGPHGRITRDDVLAVEPETEPDKPATPLPAAREPEPLPAPETSDTSESAPLSRMRQQIARVTVRSKTEKPHFYVTCDVDMTRAMELRRQLNEALDPQGVRVTVNDLVIKACVEALKQHPKFNAVFQDDSIHMNEEINIGVAIAEEEGLIMPAIMDCAGKSLKELAVASKDLADRARSGTLHPREYSGGTFAVSNMGMFDVTSFSAIIQPPQSAILAVGSVAKRPAVVDDDLAVAEMMTATLSADHRIVDGAEGARFITEVKRLLESPLSLLDVVV